MPKVLTSPGIAKMKHSGGPHPDEVPDGSVPGLYLVIYPSGKKSYALRYRRPDGRTAKIVLGTFNPARNHKADPDPVIGGYLTLAAARRLAGKLLHDIRMGKDPAAIHRAERESVALSAADAFAGAASGFIKQHAKKQTRRWKVQARYLGLRDANGDLELIDKGLASRWRDKPVTEIDADAVFRIVEEVRHKGVPGLKRLNAEASESRARAMHNALSKMFSWLMEKRRIKASPMVGLKRPATAKTGDRALSEREIIALWRAANGEGSSPFGPMIKLLLLTGCRLNEVARMEVKELSDDYSTWTIPGRRTKNKRVHVVPLLPLARTIWCRAPSRVPVRLQHQHANADQWLRPTQAATWPQDASGRPSAARW